MTHYIMQQAWKHSLSLLQTLTVVHNYFDEDMKNISSSSPAFLLGFLWKQWFIELHIQVNLGFEFYFFLDK